MARMAGSKLKTADFTLPDVATGYGSGTNTITATSFTDLPTTACVAAITNPHPTASLICLVEFGAWLEVSANTVRCCPRVSGATTIAAGIGANGPVGWGEVPMTGSTGAQHKSASATYVLAVGTSTFTMQAYRDSAAGTQLCNYPTIRIIPLYYSL